MKKKMLVIMLLFIFILHSTVVFAEGFKYVEIFDPKKDDVVKLVQINGEIHDMVETWIKDVDNIYGKSNPMTNDGYAIRVPLDPPVKVQGKCIDTLVNDVYIIVPEKEIPFFIIFDSDKKLLCYPFKGNVNKLSRVLDFKLKS